MSEAIEHPELELSSYLDGELDSGARGRVEAHLESCGACTALLAELRGLVTHARALEDRAPTTDLWGGIEARIGAPAVVSIPMLYPVARARAMARRFSFSFPQLAAAAMFVALLSGGTVWWMGRSMSRGSSPAAGMAARSGVADSGAASAGSGTSDASTADFEIRQYDQAVADLQRVLDENRARLDPETVKVVESNLAVIDSAILQARKALMADPANPYLTGHLADQMKRKIRLLQRTSDAVTADFSGSNS